MPDGVVKVTGTPTVTMADGQCYDAADVVSCTVGGRLVVPPGVGRSFYRPLHLPRQLAYLNERLYVSREWNWEIVGVQVQPTVETKAFVPWARIAIDGDVDDPLLLDGGWLQRGAEPVTPYRVRRSMSVAITVGWFGEPCGEIPLHVSLRGFFGRARR